MKKIIYLSIALLWCMGTAVAQEGGFTRRVDISRDYTVGVSSAEKLATPVEKSDTVITRPQLQFGIRPTEWNSSFETAPLKAASLSASEWVRQQNFYMKAAAGYPWRTALDFYYTPVRERRSTLGLYLNHEGIEGKTTNLMGERLSALSLQNRVGAFYEHYGRLSTFTLTADDRFDVYNPYGGYDSGGSAVFDRQTITYNRLAAAAKLEGRFSDSDDLNYSAELKGQHLEGKSYGDRHGCTDYGVSFGIDGIGSDSTSFFVPSSVRVEHSACICPVDGMHNITFSVMPEWNFRFGDFPLSLGVGYLYNNALAGGSSNVLFDINFRNDRNVLFTPFVAASRQLIDNDFDIMAERNPYLKFGTSVPNAMKTLFGLGIEGAKSAFSYSIMGGGELYDHYTAFALIEGGMPLFDAMTVPLTLWYAAAEVSLRTSASFVVNLSGRFNAPAYGTKNDYEKAVGIPVFEAGTDFAWTIARRLTIRAGVELRGMANHLVLTPATGVFEVKQLPTTCNLKASAEYSVDDKISAFLEADNILNQTIYNYYSYRRLGFGVIGGVKMSF